MTERPILFSAPMVRAILAGTKTQTRRVVKFPKNWVPCLEDERDAYNHNRGYGPVGLHIEPRLSAVTDATEGTYDVLACPYGAPGDRLWVRETWRPHPDNQCERITYAADGAVAYENEIPNAWRRPVAAERGNVPAIHMPRWASRITLEVTGVRVERLCDISEADAKAEGVTLTTMPEEWQSVRSMHGYNEAICFDREPSAAVVADLGLRDLRHVPGRAMMTARQQFERLWESINGAESWKANPWVWVVEFKREAA